MKEKKFRSGQKIRIKKDISKTKRYYDSTSEMHRMADEQTTYTIESVNASGDRVYFGGFVWHPDDLILGDDPKPLPLKKTNILFDPSELM